MRILWLSMNPGLYGVSEGNAKQYNGGGWISSLQRLFEDDKDVELALVFTTELNLENSSYKNFAYYPVQHTQSRWQKIKEYYGGYKYPDMTSYIDDIQKVVEDFHPDVIHIFGLENPMANILGKLNIPQVVHLQGLIIPIQNTFWPVGFSQNDFFLRPSKREWLFRNGFVYSYKSIKGRANREKELFKRLEYVMGRTRWDRNITELYAPQAKYYHVNEVLRPIFYEHQNEWKPNKFENFKIISVISETIYKGLDLIMKTAQLLTSLGVQFEWNVVGIKSSDRIVKYFEKNLEVKSENVNIHYCGVMSAEEICEEALSSSLYVHPSYIDNSPNSLCEAQLLGLPVVATNVGGIPSLLEGCEPLQLVPTNGVCDLAHSIIMLQKHLNLAESISAKGYELAKKRHDREEIKRALISTYQSVIIDYVEKKI